MKNILILLLMAVLAAPSGMRAQAVILKTDTISLPCALTDTFRVPVRVKSFTNVGSFQFTLSWNPTYLDYQGVTKGLSTNPFFLNGASPSFDTLTFINAGKLTFAWNRVGGLTVNDSTVVFYVVFRRLGGPYTPVQLISTPVGIEVTDPLGEDLPWKTQSGGVMPIDNILPTITCPLNMNQQVSGPSPINGISPISVADNCTLQSVGWTSTGSTPASFPTDPDASGAIFGFGLSTVTYTATDVGGNTATCSFTINLEPSISSDTLTLLLENSPASCGSQVALDVTTFNFDSLGSLQFSVNWDKTILKFDSISINGSVLILSNSNFGTSLAVNGMLSFAWTTNSLAGTTVDNGALLFRIYFTAISSGIASVQFGDQPTSREAFTNTVEEISAFYIPGQVMVTDNVPPTLVCPADISVQTQPGDITAAITGTALTTLTDNCGTATSTYTSTGATPGTGTTNADGTYNAGNTTVTYTATDESGNTATCSFTVNVDAGTSVKLMLEDLAADCQSAGQQVTMNFTVADFADIIGLQFVIEWDPSQLQLASGVTNVYPGLDLNPGNFQNYQDTMSGTLRFLGGSASGDWPNIPDGGTFFSLVFNVINADPPAIVQFSGPFDAVNGQYLSVPVETTNGSVNSTIDAEAPTFTFCPTDTTITPPSGVCQVVLDYQVQATDACSGVASILTNQADNIFTAGSTTVIYTATDVAGNSSLCSFKVSVLVDNVPAVSCPPNIIVNAADTACTAVITWDNPVLTGVCDFTNIVDSSNYTSGDTFPVGPAATVNYTLRDTLSGLEYTCSFTVTVADTTRPVVLCPENVLVEMDSVANCQAIVNFTAATASDNCDQTLDVSADYNSGNSFGTGTTTVTYLAVDDFNNTATCTFDITVPDVEPPTLTCPANITVSVTPDSCTAIVTWTSPQPTDNCDPGQINPVSDYLSGQTFPADTTIVTYMASDNSGNEATCSFSIVVLEDQPPVLTPCPANILVQLPLNQCDTTITWIAPTATDNCSQPTVEPAQSSQLFPTGITIVTYTATDASQNTATCTFSVSVVDQVPPVFGPCPQDTVINTTDPCGALYTWVVPLATDNCTPDSSLVYSTSKMPTDTFSIGITTVVMEVKDASGNRDSCSFKVTVNSTVVPQFVMIPDTIKLSTLGCTAVATWNPPSVEGFCTPPVITSNYEPGDTFPVGTTVVKYIATNPLGVETMATFVVIVTESVPPQLACPTEDVVVSVTGGIIADASGFLISADTANACTGVVLTFNNPTATDNCGAAMVIPVSGLSSTDTFPAGGTTLIFSASDVSGNTATCSFNIVVQALEALTPIVDPNPGCPGEQVTLTVTNIPGATYSWTGPQQSYPNSSVITLSSLNQGNAGTYSVVGSLNGCSTPPGLALVQIVVKPDAREDLNFMIDPGATDTFNVLANDTLFIPGDIQVTQLSQLEGLTYDGNGNFIYTAGATPGQASFIYQICSRACPDDQFCDMATVTITIKDAKCLFIPNIFTPNGDDVNDWLSIDCLNGGGFPENSIVIYNQWGGKVYEASPYDNDPAKAWRGTLNGEPGKDLPDGVYYYVFRAGPTESVIKGFVQIYR